MRNTRETLDMYFNMYNHDHKPESEKLPELFGGLVFNEQTMKERLSSASYKAWKSCVTNGTPLGLDTANEIAEAMKQWAVEKGATHYTHWFQPMTGVTAEKHESFINPVGGGKILMEFSGSGASRTRRHSRRADCGRRLRRADIRHGIRRRSRLSKKALCVSRRFSVRIPDTRWTRKRRY